MNLRKKINKDLEKSMERTSEWGLPVELIAPDGVIYNKKFDAEEETQLTGQVLYNQYEFNPATGEETSIDEPMVTLRLESLERIPEQGEVWSVKIPTKPDPDAPLETFAQTPGKAMKFNRSIGYVIMYLSRVEQL